MKFRITWVRKFWQEDCSAIFSRSASHLLPIQKPFDISIEATSLHPSHDSTLAHSAARGQSDASFNAPSSHLSAETMGVPFPLAVVSISNHSCPPRSMINCYLDIVIVIQYTLMWSFLLNTSLFSSNVENPDCEPGSFFVQNFSQRTRIVLRAGGIWDAKMKAAEPVITTLRCVPSHQGDLEDSNQT